jgi:CheY-like chemotaxis protein
MSGEADSTRSVLLVDDDEDVRDVLVWAFVEDGYEVAAADRGDRAAEMLASGSFDALVTDLRLPDMNGAEVVRQMRGLELAIPTVVISGYAGCLEASRLRDLGVRQVLPKPFKITDLLREVRELIGEASERDALLAGVRGGHE